MKMQANTTLFFYQNGKITTVSEKGRPRTIFRADDQPLAEQHAGDAGTPGLLATDDKGSVLTVQIDDEEEDHAYSAYGHDPSLPSLRTSSGFNGEQVDAVAAAYLLGNGYRLFNPVLMRFQAPDNISPFGEGGLNSYCYCLGDPVNRTDPDGHWSLLKPKTWFRSPAQKIKNRIKAAENLKPEVEKLTEKINKLESEYTDLEKQEKSKKYTQQLRPLLGRMERKIEGANKYKTEGEKYIFPEVAKAKQALTPAPKHNPTSTQHGRGFFSPTRHRDDPYDDENYRANKTTHEVMSDARRT